MRIVTWNVNGIKTLLQYHPWNKKKTYEGIIEDLGGDITCIQETKITRAQMEKGMAIMENYDSFFSFYRKTVRGIHGTAIFTKRDVVVPVKAEEGIGSALLPATLTEKERIGGYPLSSEVDLDYGKMKELDAEGRTTIIDTGMFVLINLYCPNETNDQRLVFKNEFNSMVDRRVRNLIREGREVIVLGDLNICASDLDTAEPSQRAQNQGLEQFTDHPPRKWLKEFTGPDGPMVDTTRAQFPDRKGMFTCWNTKIDARPSNYGTRLDYILVTRGLLPWIKSADIQRDIVGSDHCPVFLDFHDSIKVPGRGTVYLKNELNPQRKPGDAIPEPPAFACKFYDEYSGKQKTLASFFGRGAMPKAPASSTSNGASPSPQPVASTSKLPPSSSVPPPSSSKEPATEKVKKSQSQEPETKKNGKGKAKEVEKPAPPVVKKKGQQSLNSFFLPPPEPEPTTKKRKKSSTPSSSTTTVDSKKKKKKVTPEPPPRPSPSPSPSTYEQPGNDEDDDDMIIMDDPTASATLSSQPSTSQAQAVAEVNAQAASVWQNVFAPKAAPLCQGHQEPTKMWTVNKPGINKGRKFYLCARPVGPGYDKGQAKINVNPEYRCDHFEWATKVLRPAGMVENMNSKKSPK
ncbi:DNA-(apurinic or apyrimidinic site) lyase APN2 [Sporobolomyces salmoneus]|uniref:DNA-(apurinic or apyrimidinic site) lyase APN2 n=1 Tax=Sporobolomyces salmoneus TaxID=183962 RepID=UPI00316D0D23